jgi:hypothetical protein
VKTASFTVLVASCLLDQFLFRVNGVHAGRGADVESSISASSSLLQ